MNADEVTAPILDTVAVEFTYVVGPRPERDPNGTGRDLRTERIR